MKIFSHISVAVASAADFIKKIPAFLHVLVAALVVAYALFGAAGFMYFELEQSKLMAEEQHRMIVKCIEASFHKNKHLRSQIRAEVVYKACSKPYIPVPQWTYPNCVVFAFTIMATVGFTLSPQTMGGQLFFIFFALVGIPISMLVLANIGAYMKEGTCKFMTFVRQQKAKRRKKRLRAMMAAQAENENEEEEEEAEMDGSALLIVCVIYMFIGASLLLVLRDDGPNSAFVPSVYKTFVVMTGGDFGQMSGGRLILVLLKLFYASVGLAIATMAIDVGSAYLKKLHNFGKKLKNAAGVKVWFGGKQLSVKELLAAVGQQCDVPLDKLQSLNLENIVENAVAVKEGKTTEEENQPLVVKVQDPAPLQVVVEPEPVPDEPDPEPQPKPEPEPEPQPELQPEPEPEAIPEPPPQPDPEPTPMPAPKRKKTPLTPFPEWQRLQRLAEGKPTVRRMRTQSQIETKATTSRPKIDRQRKADVRQKRSRAGIALMVGAMATAPGVMPKTGDK